MFIVRFFLPILILLSFLSPSAIAQNDSMANRDESFSKQDSTIDSTFKNKGNNEEPADSILIDKKDFSGTSSSYLGDYNKAYFSTEKLNTGIDEDIEYLNLETPQAALEHFYLSALDTNFKAAAYALNLNRLSGNITLDTAAMLAHKLFYIMDKRVNIAWDALPDRPDGQIDNPGATAKQLAGMPRRSIKFGSLSVDGISYPLRVERYRVGDAAPIWLISANTVENIEKLYQDYGPSSLEKRVPGWMEYELLGIQTWKMIGLIVLAFLCILIYKGIKLLMLRTVGRSDELWVSEISSKISTPIALAVSVLTFYLVTDNLLSISGKYSPIFYSLMLVIVIGCVIWLLMRSIDYIMNRIQERQVNDVSDEENHESRRLLTHISVARKVIMFIVVLIGIGIILSQFETLQNLGVSLLASAGLATVILGIAAQGTLGNIVAGMQIAITKPVRIGDTVMYEGNWGTIEEIRFTYLTVDTWDHRRVIVPLKYFISKPFENWSKNDPHLIKPIYLYLDYKANVQDIREKFEELLKADDDYDGEEPAEVLVTECAEEHIKLRFKCSAKTPTKAWELHCRIREQLAKYIGENKSDNLSRERIMFMNELETSGNSESSNSNTYSTYTHNGEKRISTDDNS